MVHVWEAGWTFFYLKKKILYAFTLSHSHTEAAQSITAQLGVLNIPLFLSPSIFPETYGSQIGDLADFSRVRSWVFVRDLRLQV